VVEAHLEMAVQQFGKQHLRGLSALEMIDDDTVASRPRDHRFVID